MALQQRISLARNQAQVGRQLDALVEAHGEMESMAPAGKGGRTQKPRRQIVSLARSYRDAPEVDGLVIIPGALPLGEMTATRITGAIEYDLVGEPVGDLVVL
jgi:ribosomal protein S12 methylthiotransferase